MRSWNVYDYFSEQNYRRPRHFRYTGQEKKNLKEDPRLLWRKHKRLNEDRRKDAYWPQSWKGRVKYYAARKHRVLERKMIKAEKFDELHNLTYKYAEDPWSWD